jgi:hypothetical protein
MPPTLSVVLAVSIVHAFTHVLKAASTAVFMFAAAVVDRA